MTRGLLVDYGGVLTPSVGRFFRAFERRHGLPKGALLRVIATAYGPDGRDHPIARFERGELTPREFEDALAGLLEDAGHRVPVGRITAELFGGHEPDGPVWDLVLRARTSGVRTGLLSNSWGVEGYPRERLSRHFDAVLISGEIGMRKPDPEIYLHAADVLEVPVTRCAFVDDLPLNVEAAQRVGMFGVVHADPGRTVAALSEFLGIDLASV